ncbi:B12-binding protein [Deltaproteobacteria bacterium]|nr:B12-binding protein [Deltaproteobacteria bacterium]
MRHLLPLLPKPSRYLGIEPGSIHKDPLDVSFRLALCFPDKYEVGMSYLGQKILYGLLNGHKNWQAERLFAPDMDAAEVLRRFNAPLCTMESDTPIRDLAAIGFSITHELCYSNVLYVLDLGGIPLYAQERAADSRKWPLIMAGGGGTLAAEPLAPFIDVMFLGEGEDIFIPALEILEKYRNRGGMDSGGRVEMLREMARLPGVYVPEFYRADSGGKLLPLFPDLRKPGRCVVPDLDDAPYPLRQVIPFGAVHNRLALEIARGCTRGCRFCQAGMTYRPLRERSVASLTTLVDACLADTGYGDLSFLSLSTGDFSALKTLFTRCMKRCREEEIALSLPSLRVGSVDDDIMGQVADIRRTGATLAPEAGSQRLRDIINKNITENDLICHVQKLFEHGWQQIKLYFMIGLPTETDEDILAIADLCRKARDAAGPGIKRLQITAGISPFVPKPHTPFQWEAQISREEIHRRIGILLGELKKEKRVTMRWHDPETSFLEGIFSRGDRRLAPVVEQAYKKGAVFAGWMEHFTLAPWLEALAEANLSPEMYLGAIPPEAPLPWDHLENGVSREFLLRERANAMRGKTAPDCRYASCLVCGACDTQNAPSLLPKRDASIPLATRLNLTRRDQDAHNPTLDEHGRVVPKNGWGSASAQPQKKLPPAINANLAQKARHLRLWYTRVNLAAYLSQLEIQSLFERALRRAEIPLSFSQGFHPLPLLSFCRALPVGIASEGEWLRVYLREQYDSARLSAKIGEIVPGLRITDIEILPLNARPQDNEEDIFRLEFLGDDTRLAAFSEALADITAADSIPWTRTTKNGEKQMDMRQFIQTILPSATKTSFLRLSWKGGYVSPLALVSAALNRKGTEFALSEFALTKLRSAI